MPPNTFEVVWEVMRGHSTAQYPTPTRCEALLALRGILALTAKPVTVFLSQYVTAALPHNSAPTPTPLLTIE